MKTEAKATTKIWLEKRREILSDPGRYAVKLRVTYKTRCRYYTLKDPKRTSLHLSENDFIRVMGKAPRALYKEIKLHLSDIEKKAIGIIDKLPAFSFEAFEAKFFSKAGEGDVFTSLENRARALRKDGRVATAVTYECALNSLKKYTGKKILLFEHLTSVFFQRYENWMSTRGNSLTTVGIYARCTRAVVNTARRDGILKDIPYPFGQGGYQIPAGKNLKKALTASQVGLIAAFSLPPGSMEDMYRDLWMFSFLCNGINMKDVFRLTYGNIDSDIIKFTRAKTQRDRRRNPKQITVIIASRIGRIIDKWGNKPGLPETYIFPVLHRGISPEDEYNRIQDFVHRINSTMERISENLKIPKTTTYGARHTYATLMKRAGASVEFISEALGHKSLVTTENYLADFEIDEKRRWAEKLTEGL